MPALPSSSSSGSSFPSSFRVRESLLPSTTSTTSDSSTFASLQSSISSRALQSHTSLHQKLAQIELLSSPLCTSTDLRTASSILDLSSWNDLLEERHMEAMCPYPTCPNPPSRGYDPKANEEAIKFKLRGNALLESSAEEGEGGGDKGAFCSRRCRARAEWYKINCVGRNTGGRIELLEDVQLRRRQVARSTKEMAAEQAEVAVIKPEKSTSNREEERLRPADDSERRTTAQLFDSLTIRERPTEEQDQPPLAPSFHAPDFEGSSSRQHRTLKPTSSTPLPPPPTALPSLRPLSSTPAAAAPSSPPPIRLPSQSVQEAPMPRFTSPPVMLDEKGREVEWDVDPLGEEGGGEEEREAWGWLERARREAEREVG